MNRRRSSELERKDIDNIEFVNSDDEEIDRADVAFSEITSKTNTIWSPPGSSAETETVSDTTTERDDYGNELEDTQMSRSISALLGTQGKKMPTESPFSTGLRFPHGKPLGALGPQVGIIKGKKAGAPTNTDKIHFSWKAVKTGSTFRDRYPLGKQLADNVMEIGRLKGKDDVKSSAHEGMSSAWKKSVKMLQIVESEAFDTGKPLPPKKLIDAITQRKKKKKEMKNKYAVEDFSDHGVDEDIDEHL